MISKVDSRGFTLIETVLAIGISGLMMMGIMLSVGVALSNQRYKDAVNSTLDYFQGQYNLVMNVRNDRNSNSYCNGGAISAVPTVAARGTSDCTIIGRTIRSSGASLTSTPIYATVNLLAAPAVAPTISTSSPVEDLTQAEVTDLAWGTRLFPSGNKSQDQKFSMAIIRSPYTGVVSTYTDVNSATTTLLNLLNQPSALTTSGLFCVDADNGPLSPANLGVRLLANGTNSSAVQLVSDGGGCP